MWSETFFDMFEDLSGIACGGGSGVAQRAQGGSAGSRRGGRREGGGARGGRPPSRAGGLVRAHSLTFGVLAREGALQAEGQCLGQVQGPSAGAALFDLGTAAEAVGEQQ